jgi:Methyltransferase domain
VRALAAVAPRVLPLNYLGAVTGREYGPERLQHDILQGVGYTQVYDRYLKGWRGRRFSMLEIGVWQGNSLRMYAKYFRRATVLGLDIDPQAAKWASEFPVYVGSQDDPELLDRILAEHPDLRLVIDDGAHINEVTVATFEHVFPRLPSGSLYAIEDLGVSYEDGELAPDFDWHGMDLNRPQLRHERRELDELFGRLVRDCDLGGSKRQAAFVHFWPMCVVIGRA